jgi:hypothetical protein
MVASGFHGTSGRFQSFSAAFSGTAGLPGAEYGEAFFFSDSMQVAEDYAHIAESRRTGKPSILSARITFANPLSFDFERDCRAHLNIDESSRDDEILVQEELINLARQAGHDGLIITNFNDGGEGSFTQYVAFSPEQIAFVEWLSVPGL